MTNLIAYIGQNDYNKLKKEQPHLFQMEDDGTEYMYVGDKLAGVKALKIAVVPNDFIKYRGTAYLFEDKGLIQLW